MRMEVEKRDEDFHNMHAVLCIVFGGNNDEGIFMYAVWCAIGGCKKIVP